MTLFCQVWFELAGVTVRLEDIITMILIGTPLLLALLTGKLRYYRSPLNLPLFLWATVIGMGIIVTLTSSLDGVTKKDALVNGIRLILAVRLFFVICHTIYCPPQKLKVADWSRHLS